MLKSSSSEKKLVKPLKNCFFGPNLHRKGVIMGHTQDEKKAFLTEITKADHQLSEFFYFIKISYVLTELWIFLYLEWCFLSNKCHFQLKPLRLLDWDLVSHHNEHLTIIFRVVLTLYVGVAMQLNQPPVFYCTAIIFQIFAQLS